MKAEEIRFRSWDPVNKKMVDLKKITPLALDSNLRCDGIFIPFNGSELMQFTGCQDRNGKDIYEGDVLAREENDDGFNGPINYIDYCVVKWLDLAWKVDFHGEETILLDEYGPSTGEVAGNTFENPDLANGMFSDEEVIDEDFDLEEFKFNE
jgi:uncharacterized phage protein (TIGR01671 family)